MGWCSNSDDMLQQNKKNVKIEDPVRTIHLTLIVSTPLAIIGVFSQVNLQGAFLVCVLKRYSEVPEKSLNTCNPHLFLENPPFVYCELCFVLTPLKIRCCISRGSPKLNLKLILKLCPQNISNVFECLHKMRRGGAPQQDYLTDKTVLLSSYSHGSSHWSEDMDTVCFPELDICGSGGGRSVSLLTCLKIYQCKL